MQPWVIILFVISLYDGFKHRSKKKEKIKGLIVSPLIFSFLTVHALFITFTITPIAVLFLATALIVGVFFGYLPLRNITVRADKKKMLVEIPTEWATLILSICIFALKFGFSFFEKPLIGISQETWFVSVSMILFGLFTGMIFGINGLYFYKYTQTPHEDLLEEKKH